MEKDILARYTQAQAINQGFMPGYLTRNDSVLPHWLEGNDHFLYIRQTATGKEFRLVDTHAKTNEVAFDHQALAHALTKVAGESATDKIIKPEDLPITDVTMSLSPIQVRFQSMGKQWLFDPGYGGCEELGQINQSELVSPDGTLAAFVREHNLWVRDTATCKERFLTQDGTADNSYATSGALSTDSRVQAAWSPDSKRLFTVKFDARGVSTRSQPDYWIEDAVMRNALEVTIPTKRMPMSYPGDKQVECCQLLVIDVATGNSRPADYPAVPSMMPTEHGFGFFTLQLAWWSNDSQHAYFLDIARGSQAVRVIQLDTVTGSTRVVIDETSSTFVKLRNSMNDLPHFRALPDSDELIWFSESAGWGHLYLYDLKTGNLKRQITGDPSSENAGQWLVREVLHCNAERRELIVQTTGRHSEFNPYYRDICLVNIDTGAVTELATGNVDHLVYSPNSFPVPFLASIGLAHSKKTNGVSPSGEYIVTTRSRVDCAPESVLINREGQEVLSLETTDISNLPSDWQWPESVKLKAADGKTDVYGVVFKPPGFDATERYPVIDYSSSMRSSSALPHGSFANGPVIGWIYYYAASLAALGFIVVAIDGRGLPLRDKLFQDHQFGDPAGTSDLNDRIAGIKQLAELRPYMDIERVGIVGTETANNAVYGVLKHSNFYKVCVHHCLCDPSTLPSALAETYEGVFEDGQMTRECYAADHADSFNGKLLLIQGMRTWDGAKPMFRLVEALQAANKDFDMLCLPNMFHAMLDYTTRREWDYFVTHLLGEEPPKEFRLRSGIELPPKYAV